LSTTFTSALWIFPGATRWRRRRSARRQPAGAQALFRLGAQCEPATMVVPAWTSMRLVFCRQASSGRRDGVVFPDLGWFLSLPVARDVEVQLPSLGPGEYCFTCSDGRPWGSIVVIDPDGSQCA
jgi:plastocyanin domain-containing protein